MIFRRTDKYGYSRYYGGGGPAFVIKVVATILLMVALVVGAAAFVVQKYMVYTENGGHLELPWAKKTTQTEPDTDPGGLEGLVIEEDRSAEASASAEGSVAEQPRQPGLWERFVSWLQSLFQASAPVPAEVSSPVTPGTTEQTPMDPADAEETQPQQPETTDQQPEQSAAQSQAQRQETVQRPKPLSGGLLLQHVSIGDVKGGYAEGDIKNKKGNGIMLFMKESGGKLNFSSNQGLAEELEVNGDAETGETIADVVSELKGKDYYTLAYVDGFQDQEAGSESDLRLYDQDGDAWQDGEDRAWADPSNVRYQNYLVALIRELDKLGFDEVVLNNAGYPATGKTSNLSEECYDPAKFESTITDFYEKLAEDLKDCKCMVSVITTEEAIREGYDEATGQSLSAMLKLGGRLWVDTDRKEADELTKALEQAGYPDNALGVLVSSLREDDGFNQMNLD